MKGQITREHDKNQGFSRVSFEGGSAITDADLNAAFDAQSDQFQQLTSTWIAPAGTADDGWHAENLHEVVQNGDTWVNFDLAQGHYTLEGEMLHNSSPFPFNSQPHGQSASLEPDMALLKPTLAEIQAMPNQTRYDAVYLDSVITSVLVEEDSELDEVASPSAPAAREISVNKVRIITDIEGDCATAREQVLDGIAGTNGTFALPSPRIHSNGRLRVSLGTAPTNDNPCAPDQATGYFGRLNQTVKVKMTAPDAFVWAYDNGAHLYRVTLDAGDDQTLRLITPFADAALFPVSGQIAEICAWDARLPNGEMTAQPLGRFHAIATGYNPTSETLSLDTAIDADLRAWYDTRLASGDAPFLFLRIWEPATTLMDNSTPSANDVPLADTGVHLHFEADGTAGDQWTFSLRTNANDTVFPKRFLYTGGQPPSNLKRAADLLATIHWEIVNDVVIGHLHDCRRRIRPLWQQKGCCTFTVGDGHSSHGDFDTIQTAIDALPHTGGRICLLPGQHLGGVELQELTNITIEGCKGQTHVHSTGTSPVFRALDCTSVTFKDFTIQDGDNLAIAGARNTGVKILNINTSGRGSAISVMRSQGLVIRDCSIIALAELSAIESDQYANLRPLVVVGGTGLDITNNLISCQDHGLTLQPLGGLQIASGSSHVRIAKNVINAGVGHGVTCGDLKHLQVVGLLYIYLLALLGLAAKMANAFESNSEWNANHRSAQITGVELTQGETGATAADQTALNAIAMANFEMVENQLEISHVAVQGCVGIDPTPEQPTPADTDNEWGLYFITGRVAHIHIVDNEIANMGGSGISIPSWNLAGRASIGINFVDDITIERNHISNCARVAVATTLNSAELQELGYGGIALESVKHAKISNNIIENIGTDIRSPVVGIYIKTATAAHINDNVLRNIGRIEDAINTNILGVSGGILIDNAAPEYGGIAAGFQIRDLAGMTHSNTAATHMRANPDATPQLARGDALRIENNQVTVNFGMSLDIRGKGSMMIANNHLMSSAARFNLGRIRLSTHVSIVNTDVPYIELITFIVAIFDYWGGAFGNTKISKGLLALLAAFITKLAQTEELGILQVHGNHTKLENFITNDDAISAHAVISPWATQLGDNVFKTIHVDDGTVLNLLSAGFLSMQCTSNYLQTIPPNGVVDAAMTIGFGNSTYLNHATQGIRTVLVTTSNLASGGNLTA